MHKTGKTYECLCQEQDAADLETHGNTENFGHYALCYSINEQNGCALTIWKEMEWEKELSRNGIKYFQRMCEPKLTVQQCEAKNRTLDLHIHLQPNEIAFIRIRASYTG